MTIDDLLGPLAAYLPDGTVQVLAVLLAATVAMAQVTRRAIDFLLARDWAWVQFFRSGTARPDRVWLLAVLTNAVLWLVAGPELPALPSRPAWISDVLVVVLAALWAAGTVDGERRRDEARLEPLEVPSALRESDAGVLAVQAREGH